MLKANEGYIIIEVVENSNVSPGGIVMPESSVKQSNQGVIIDVGVYGDEYYLPFRKGHLVFFPLYSGHKINHAGKDYIVLKEEDVLAFVEED